MLNQSSSFSPALFLCCQVTKILISEVIFANCENGKASGRLPHIDPDGTFCVSTQVLHQPTLPRRQTMHDCPGQGPQGGHRRRVPQRRQPWHWRLSNVDKHTDHRRHCRQHLSNVNMIWLKRKSLVLLKCLSHCFPGPGSTSEAARQTVPGWNKSLESSTLVTLQITAYFHYHLIIILNNIL